MTGPIFDCTLFSHPQERDSGDYLHRVAWPATALGRFLPVTAIQSTHPSYQLAIRSTGLLVIKMVADERLLEVIHERDGKGLPTVCEISDDFESFPAHLPSHGFYARPEVQAMLRELIRQASAVQFSSSHLARKYGHLNPNHAVFLNQLDTLPPLAARSKRPLTIGWSGSLGHLEDARKLAAMLARWPNREKVKIAVMAAPGIVAAFREQELAVEETAPGNMAAYFAFLDRLDIGIAVIGNDEFSAGRSDGKFLEYASHGAVAVCSRAGSYAETIRDGETGCLFSSEEELFAALDRLIQDHELRDRIRTQAHAYLLDERMHGSAAQERLKFYRSLAENHPRMYESRSPFSPAQPSFEEIIHPIEAKLFQAMMLHSRGELQQALALYTELLTVAPDFFLIWERLRDLCSMAGLDKDAQLCGQKATELYPGPRN